MIGLLILSATTEQLLFRTEGAIHQHRRDTGAS
jgi:hypothetical protein